MRVKYSVIYELLADAKGSPGKIFPYPFTPRRQQPGRLL